MAGRIARSALLLCGVASGLRKSRTQNTTGESLRCIISRVLFGAVRHTSNHYTSEYLQAYDPLNTGLKDVNREVLELPRCPLDLTFDVDFDVRGLSGFNVGELVCESSVCLESSLLRCTKEIYNFSVDFTFKENVALAAEMAGNWSLCGLFNAPTGMYMGFEVVDAKTTVKLQVEVTRGLLTRSKIIGADGTSVSIGRYSNFECGFENLPNVVENWCSTLGNWLLGKVNDYVRDPINDAINNLVGKLVDFDEEDESAFSD